MAFYAGEIVKHPAMENPTLVVITDRNDLDDQLFGTFSMCRELLAKRCHDSLATSMGISHVSKHPQSQNL